MESLLGPQGSRQLIVAPDHHTGVPMLMGWVGVVAYVVSFSFFHGVYPEDPFYNASNWVKLRNVEMDLYQNTSADGCSHPHNSACGSYSQISGVSPFVAASYVVQQEVHKMEVYKECKRTVIFDDCDDTPEETLYMTLMLGKAVKGWVARAGIHNGRVALHVFNVDRQCDTHTVNSECAMRLFENYWWDDIEPWPPSTDFDVVVYDDEESTDDGSGGENDTVRFCDLQEFWNDYIEHHNMTEPAPDCPSSCTEVIEKLASERVAAEMEITDTTLARLVKLSGKLKANAGVNTTLHFGGGPGLVYDSPFDGSISVRWENRLALELAMLGETPGHVMWPAAAHEVNAFYDPCQNAVFVPSGILTPPFYHETYDDELVAGGIGFVIAHELGHAMDHLLNESEVRIATVGHMAAITNVPIQVVNHTVSEDVADELGGELLQKSTKVTRRVGLQLAQCWCLGATNFTSDVHAPGPARVDTLMTEGGALGGILCS